MTMEALLDYQTSTDYVPMPDRNKFKNLATRNTYILPWLLGDSDSKRNLQGGKGIRLYAMPSDKSTATWAVPGEPLDIFNPQVLEKHEADWRFLLDHMVFNDVEATLNGNAPIAEQLMNIMEVKEERVATSVSHAWEDSIGATPSYALQEAAGGKKPMSAFAYNTEAEGVAPMWGGTKVMGFDPDAIKGWDNTRKGYARINKDAAGTGRTLQQALSSAARRAKFMVLPIAEYANTERQESKTPRAWFTGEWGLESYADAVLNQSHDALLGASKQDLAVNAPMHHGIPIVFWERMEEVELYANGANFKNEKEATITGPRFMGWNRNDLYPVMHSSNYFKKADPMKIHNQPMDRVAWRSTWTNLVCSDRRSQAWVYPTTAIAIPA